MNNFFESNPKGKIPRNKFNLTHDRKFSFNMGKLYPICVMEAVPGDSFRCSNELMVRTAPLAAPVMARMKVKVESFFVPKRILWDEFEEWITGGPDGTSVPVAPYFDKASLMANSVKMIPGTLWDHMGLPTVSGGSEADALWAPKISVLAFRAYAHIWNEWYRIPELMDPIDVTGESGAIVGGELTALLEMQRRCWERDYFNTCQPNAQRGVAAAAPIDIAYAANSTFKKTADGLGVPVSYDAGIGANGVAGELGYVDPATNNRAGQARIENIGSASVLVEAIRVAAAVQKWLEASARAGSRYVELLFQSFHIKSQDSRLQRPELLGGHVGNIQISEVLSTVQFEGATDDLPQGNMAGHGLHIGHGAGYTYRAPEHGFFITLMSVVPEGGRYGNGYYSGIPKMFQRFSKFDEYWPLFANLGEQAVTRKELSANMDLAAGEAQGDQVFGYTERYGEFKWLNSTVHGDFRTSLAYWQMHQGFVPDNAGLTPMLDSNFLLVDPDLQDMNRIFAVTDPDVDHFLCLAINKVSALRPMPYHVSPGGTV
ncbi:MAG: major capsid protein [Microviridae sp.]|nr:MAG: major capsid protein [Microviridae sp.]